MCNFLLKKFTFIIDFCAFVWYHHVMTPDKQPPNLSFIETLHAEAQKLRLAILELLDEESQLDDKHPYWTHRQRFDYWCGQNPLVVSHNEAWMKHLEALERNDLIVLACYTKIYHKMHKKDGYPPLDKHDGYVEKYMKRARVEAKRRKAWVNDPLEGITDPKMLEIYANAASEYSNAYTMAFMESTALLERTQRISQRINVLKRQHADMLFLWQELTNPALAPFVGLEDVEATRSKLPQLMTAWGVSAELLATRHI